MTFENNTVVDERQLIVLIGQGDRDAFRQLYAQTASQLLAVALRLLRDQAAAEDVIQEVYLTIWHAADQYNSERGGVLTWLSTITRNRCIDRIRRAPKHTYAIEEGDDFVCDRPDPLSHIIGVDQSSILYACFAKLDTQQRESVSLAFFDGMTHQQVASHLTVPLGSAKSWIRRGLEALKKCMLGGAL